MKIVNLNCEPNNKNVTICLNYENIRDIVTGLYEASEVNSKYKSIHKMMVDVFTLTTEGSIKSWWKGDTESEGQE